MTDNETVLLPAAVPSTRAVLPSVTGAADAGWMKQTRWARSVRVVKRIILMNTALQKSGLRHERNNWRAIAADVIKNACGFESC